MNNIFYPLWINSQTTFNNTPIAGNIPRYWRFSIVITSVMHYNNADYSECYCRT